MQRCSSSLLASLSAFASACAVLSAFNRQSSKFLFPSRCPDGSDELAPEVMSVSIVRHISPMIRFSSSPLQHLIWRSFLLRHSARRTLRSRFVPTGEAPIVIITVSECCWRPRTVLIIMLTYVTEGRDVFEIDHILHAYPFHLLTSPPGIPFSSLACNVQCKEDSR